MLEKFQQIQVILLFQFKMGCKAAETVRNISAMHLSQTDNI